MRMNRLGNSDLIVSAVGAGTWAMGGDFFGATDDKKCVDSLCASLDHGVNLIDTAPIYGRGHSEELVGKGGEVHYGQKADEEKKKRKELI